MTNPSWGTKRNCVNCGAHFYDLNKVPASCPKCHHEFNPALLVRPKRKPARREASDAQKDVVVSSVLAQKKGGARKKDKEADRDGAPGGGISDIAEMVEVDDLENLQELSELEEREEVAANDDDADDETIIEDLDTRGKTLVGNVEEEEANVLGEELVDEEETTAAKKGKDKKKSK